MFRLRYCLSLPLFLACSFTVSTGYAQAGLKQQVTVSQPTRLDWKFVARQFGAKAAVLPADYDSRKQKYLLYVPKNYTKDKTWPLVVFISPADSPAGWRSWQNTCEKHGVLFCSPYGAGNKTAAGLRTRIVLDVLDDVRRHYRIDPDRTYVSGFSGGGRMSCPIAYCLPKYFGGVVPVCGTNPLPRLTYLRHRVKDRLSVAFLTGEKDFNRKENEVYMYPYLKQLGIRTRLWVVPKMGHAIPGPKTIEEVFTWLEKDLPNRRADRKKYPALQVSAVKTPGAAAQANNIVQTAEKELKKPAHVWRGVTMLQGVLKRWPKSEAAATGKKLLQRILADEKMLNRVAEQGGKDERLFLLAQAKGLERFGLFPQAAQAWRMLAKNYPDTAEGKQAVAALKRLGSTTAGSGVFLGLALRQGSTAISRVVEGGPAAKAGLRADDVIKKVGKHKIASGADLFRALQRHRPGETVVIEVLRNNAAVRVSVTLGKKQ